MTTKVCRVCGAEKPIDDFAFTENRRDRYRHGTCRLCENAWKRAYHRVHPRRPRPSQALTEAEKRAHWEEEYQKIVRRVAHRGDPTPIPASDPWLDIDVIKVCWRDCVAEGEPAIRRMLKKITTVCWAIGGQADQLHAAATGYLMGSNQLGVVAEALGELGRLAVAS